MDLYDLMCVHLSIHHPAIYLAIRPLNHPSNYNRAHVITMGHYNIQQLHYSAALHVVGSASEQTHLKRRYTNVCDD